MRKIATIIAVLTVAIIGTTAALAVYSTGPELTTAEYCTQEISQVYRGLPTSMQAEFNATSAKRVCELSAAKGETTDRASVDRWVKVLETAAGQ